MCKVCGVLISDKICYKTQQNNTKPPSLRMVPSQPGHRGAAGALSGNIVSESGGAIRRANRAPSSEPTAAVGNPPTEAADWNRCAHSPPERKNEIRHQAQNRESGPEDFPLHAPSLRQTSSWCPTRISRLTLSSPCSCNASRSYQRHRVSACAEARWLSRPGS